MNRQLETPKGDKPYRAKANLDILFGEEDVSLLSQLINVNKISLPHQQPRRYFDPQKLEQLTESVKAHGILENLLVRPIPEREGSYELVAGERRYRAAIAAGLEEIPVTIRDINDEEALQISLVENLQREDLNPLEETEAILQLLALELKLDPPEIARLLQRKLQELKRQNLSHNDMGQEIERIEIVFKRLGLMNWESFTSNRLPLLNLPEDILDVLRAGRIEYTKAKAIAKVKDFQQRATLLESVLQENLSLSQIRERIKSFVSLPPTQDLQSRFEVAAKRAKKVKTLWSDPKKRKKVEKLLAQLETLIAEEENSRERDCLLH
jgi:ParB family chromosome partitioning protein